MSVLTSSGGTSSQEVAEIINRQAKTTWPAVCGGPESVMMFAVPTIQSQPQSQSQSQSQSGNCICSASRSQPTCICCSAFSDMCSLLHLQRRPHVAILDLRECP